MEFKQDCRFFKGERPCSPYKLCRPCHDYKPMGKRILIIKLGAIGDVLRTTPILPALKNKWPSSFIVWISFPESIDVLKYNPFIDVLLPYNLASLLRLETEVFDLALCLDKMADATALINKIKAEEKKGFSMGEKGELLPLNKEAEYAYCLGLDDKLKFRENKKTYQEMICELAGIPYNMEKYILNLTAQENAYTDSLRKKYRLGKKKAVGLNTGCGRVFDTKKWTLDGFVKVARLLNKMKINVLLLGGPEEVERNREISKGLKGGAIDTGCNNTMRQFMSIVDLCDCVVSADTIALHLAIALRKKVVALFGPTSTSEIDLYGRGEKITGDTACSPCYKPVCIDKNNICMESITPEMVFGAIEKLLR